MYIQKIEIEFDEGKRAETLITRGLDMARAGDVFEGPHRSWEDDRFDYGEPRYLTFGFMGDRLVLVVWTWRAGRHRIISMRKANEREKRRTAPLFGQ